MKTPVITSNNSASFGQLKVTDKFIYFVLNDVTGNAGIYKQNLLNGSKVKLFSGLACYLNVQNDFLYFTSLQSRGQLLRMNLLTKNKEKISNDICHYVTVAGEWIYYTSFIQGGAIYKIKVDGTEKSPLFKGHASDLIVSGNCLYFRKTDENSAICKIDMNTNQYDLIKEVNAKCLQREDEWIYYINTEEAFTVHRMNMETLDTEKLIDDSVSFINLSNSKVYFDKVSENSRLYEYDICLKSCRPLTDACVQFFNIDGDWALIGNYSGMKSLTSIAALTGEKNVLERENRNEPAAVHNGNVINLGIVYETDKLFIYNSSSVDGKLYIKDKLKSVITKINESSVTCISYYKDKVFFLDEEYRIVCADVCTSSVLIIVDSFCTNLLVEDDWIYYINNNDEACIYRVKHDGSQNEKICSIDTWCFNLVGDYIFLSCSTDAKIYMLHKYDFNVASLCCGPADNIICCNESIYYTEPKNEDSCLWRVNRDGTNEAKLINNRVGSFNIYNEWIFFSNISKSAKLFKVKTDGTNMQMVDDTEEISNLCILGDSLYYNSGINGNLVRLNLINNKRVLVE